MKNRRFFSEDLKIFLLEIWRFYEEELKIFFDRFEDFLLEI